MHTILNIQVIHCNHFLQQLANKFLKISKWALISPNNWKSKSLVDAKFSNLFLIGSLLQFLTAMEFYNCHWSTLLNGWTAKGILHLQLVERTLQLQKKGLFIILLFGQEINHSRTSKIPALLYKNWLAYHKLRHPGIANKRGRIYTAHSMSS